jgi:hypothetical protein
MSEQAVTEVAVERDDAFRLSAEQVAYFETFGFVKIPGLFAPDFDEITAGFEEIFEATPSYETHEWLHFDDERQIIPQFIDRSPKLAGLWTDPRVLGTVNSLMGDNWEQAESDGNLFYCDSSWHPDFYGAPLTQYHVKLSFYLDPLRADTGAIRMIPGTNHYLTNFAGSLVRNLQKPEDIEETYGVRWDEIPSHVLETDPGDLVVWSFRTIHASFGGDARRRLFSMSFREPAPAG